MGECWKIRFEALFVSLDANNQISLMKASSEQLQGSNNANLCQELNAAELKSLYAYLCSDGIF